MIDVLIIGAGPAGCIAANDIASAGFSVNIIDLKKEIGEPLQCGEVITEFCLDDMKLQKNKEWIRKKTKGVKVFFPNNNSFYSAEPRVCIDRVLFDKWLCNKAINRGAELYKNTLMKNIQGNYGNWLVKTSKGDFKAKLIIVADGPISKTSRLLDLLKNREYLKAIQYKFDEKTVDFAEEKWLIMFMDEKFNGGYAWMFPRGEEFNIGVAGSNININHLNKFCKSKNIDITKKKHVTGGLIPYNFKFSSREKNGCVILGDAGGMINPATGGGIHAALASGKISSSLIIKSLSSGNYVIKDYDNIIKKTPFLNPNHQKTANYFKKWTNDDWNFFGEAANGLEADDLTIFKSFLIGLKYPRKMFRAREFLTIRLSMAINKKYS